MTGQGLHLAFVSICKLLLPADSKVFERNNNSSALNSSPCASIVSCSGQEQKHAMVARELLISGNCDVL